MKVINQDFEILFPEPKERVYARIATAARTCYKSQPKTDDAAEADRVMVLKLVSKGHEAMLEHASMTVRFTTDRAIANELVRHRIGSYAQESTRYCNYANDKFGNEICVIDIKDQLMADPKGSRMDPKEMMDEVRVSWEVTCMAAENDYTTMISKGVSPQIARAVLPLSLATEIVATMNMREWRHVFKLRVVGETGDPHPGIRALMAPLLRDVAKEMPELFGDIWMDYEQRI